MHIHAIVNSLTPAWKNAPEKSPRVMLCVSLRNPSVLSELHKSADDTIIFLTCSLRTPRHAAEATLVGELGF